MIDAAWVERVMQKEKPVAPVPVVSVGTKKRDASALDDSVDESLEKSMSEVSV